MFASPLTFFRRARASRMLYAAHDQLCREQDPLEHPALRAMTPRELADIPFPRAARTSR
jgi:hypothetical protein